MQFTVELFGLARRLTKAKEVQVEVKQESTLRDIVVALRQRFPELVGPIIEPDTNELIMPYLFSIGGRQMVQSLDFKPREGDEILLMFVAAGG